MIRFVATTGAALCLAFALGCGGGGGSSSSAASASVPASTSAAPSPPAPTGAPPAPAAAPSSTPAAPPAPPPSGQPAIRFPRYNEVFGTATHNSYWVNRSHYLDPYASGTEERLLDQLLHERTRAIELDLHTDRGNPGVWTIYHTDRDDFSQFHTLADALQELRLFHYLVPAHEVVNVVMELKNTDPDWSNLPMTTHVFGPDHTIDAFDRTIRDALQGALYEPKDVLARAAPGLSLAQAVETAGWPMTDELRGKFIVNVLGYWGNASYDWARYGGEGDIGLRACFPLRCIFDGNGNAIGSWPGNLSDTLPSGWLAAAREASVFWQAEDLTYVELPRFLARGGIVRGHDSYEKSEQEDRVRAGYHFLQTDYPWHVIGGAPAALGVPFDPTRRLLDPASVKGGAPIEPAALIEPGLRLYASAPDPAPRVAYASVAPGYGSRRMETAVSTTRIGDTYGRSYPRVAQEGGVGGLVAAASYADMVQVLRVKTGGSGDGWHQEVLVVRVVVSRGGAVTTRDFRASDLGTSDVGSLLALEVEEAGSGTVVRALSAGRLDAAGNPAWRLLSQESFAAPMPFQGLAFTNDVLFVATTIAEGAAPARPATTCDLSLLDGGAAVLTDLSWPAPVASCVPALAPLP